MEFNVEGRIKEYRIRAELNNIRFVLDEKQGVAHASYDSSGQAVITVPRPLATWTREQWVIWHMYCEHEIGHLMPKTRDAYEVLRKYNIDTSKSVLGAMLNIYEDHRQEHTDRDVYAGRIKRLAEGTVELIKGFDENNVTGTTSDKSRAAVETAIVWALSIRGDWMVGVGAQASRLMGYLSDQQLGWMDKLQSGDYESTLKSGITAEENYQLTKRIMLEVFELDPEEDEQEEGSESEQGESTQGDDEEGGESDDEETASKKGGKVDYSDLLLHQHDKGIDNAKPSRGAIKINYDSNTCSFKETPLSDYTLVDVSNEGGGVTTYTNSMIDRIDKNIPNNGLDRHVRRLLQARATVKYQHGLKRGKISPKSIYRGAMSGTSAQDRVFKKKQPVTVLDTAVTVLVDCSGSMFGSKYEHAGIAAIMLNEAIGKLPIPLEIIAFDESHKGPRHAIWKEANKRVSKDQMLKHIEVSAEKQMSNNSDGESLMWAYNRLTKRKQSRKLLIVLSDGSPATYHGDADWYTKKVIAEIYKRGDVELYGIGIKDTNVKRLYKQCEVINNPADLEGALLKVIETKIVN